MKESIYYKQLKHTKKVFYGSERKKLSQGIQKKTRLVSITTRWFSIPAVSEIPLEICLKTHPCLGLPEPGAWCGAGTLAALNSLTGGFTCSQRWEPLPEARESKGRFPSLYIIQPLGATGGMSSPEVFQTFVHSRGLLTASPWAWSRSQ